MADRQKTTRPTNNGRDSVLSPKSSNSYHSLLPPIIANERDREFLISLNQSIDQELGKVKDRFNPEQRYAVYKAAFNQIIDYVTAYKPLLTAVKAEYEECIDTIQRGQKEAFFLSGKLKAMASEPSTLRNYRKRCDELDQRVTVIKNDNERLSEEIRQLRAVRLERERRAKEIAEPPVREIKRDRRHIPGLTVEQSTDLKVLTQELTKLERQLKELNISYRTRFQKKDTQMELKEHLAKKVSHRDHLIDQTEAQKVRRMKLKTACEAAQAYLKIQPPHQTIGDAVVIALTRQSTSMAHEKGEEGNARGTPSTTFEEDDPTREKEAEMMLEYIEKFNELIEDKMYEEAAVHAANSPKGILRTPETLNRFKDISDELTSAGRSPLLAFCDALMATVLAYGVRPSEHLSMESVKVALNEHRMDLLSHWIAQDRMTVSESLGTLLYEHAHKKPRTAKKCLAFAQKIYMDADAHVLAMKCMIKQGRVSQALEYGQKCRCHPTDYIKLLESIEDNMQLAHGLLTHKLPNKRSLVPLGVVVKTLMKTDTYENGIKLLNIVNKPNDSNDPINVLSQPPEITPLTFSSDVLRETPLRQAMLEDAVSTNEDWHTIVNFCQDMNEPDLALELLAALTLNDVLRNASQYASDAMQQAREQGLPLPDHGAAETRGSDMTLQVPTGRSARTRFVGFDDDETITRSLVTQDTLMSRTGQSLELSSARSAGAAIADDESLDEA